MAKITMTKRQPFWLAHIEAAMCSGEQLQRYKRLEQEKFAWPHRSSETLVTLSGEQLHWLLDGYDVFRASQLRQPVAAGILTAAARWVSLPTLEVKLVLVPAFRSHGICGTTHIFAFLGNHCPAFGPWPYSTRCGDNHLSRRRAHGLVGISYQRLTANRVRSRCRPTRKAMRLCSRLIAGIGQKDGNGKLRVISQTVPRPRAS